MGDHFVKQSSHLYSAIYSLVCLVPAGHVTTYGRIAQQIGCTARTVGFAMAALPAGSEVPWQRVINAQGRVSQRCDGEGNLLQRHLLENEGVQFDDSDKINLERYLWSRELK